MKISMVVALFGATVLAGPAAAAPAQQGGLYANDAQVHFQNAQNQPIGEAVLHETPNGVLVTVNLRDLPPGQHGFHFHETGACQPPFQSAGGHFNPGNKSHGFESANGPHAGDLPNMVVCDDGTVKAQFFAAGVSLQKGPHPLLDQDGAALVIHGDPDDYQTDPAGNSGARIACGIVEGPGQAANPTARTAQRPDRTPPKDVPPPPGQPEAQQQ